MGVISYGFTGTQVGMTGAQRDRVWKIMVDAVGEYGRQGIEARHGDCIGADRDFHSICRTLGLWIVGYPPVVSGKRAWCDFDSEREPREYLERNRDIVNASDVLVACPAGVVEELRSGTWSTVRYARKAGIPVMLVLPSGEVRKSGVGTGVGWGGEGAGW